MLSTHLENCVYGDDHEHGHEYQTKEERLSEIRVTLNRFLK
jgi:hypothetical protein